MKAGKATFVLCVVCLLILISVSSSRAVRIPDDNLEKAFIRKSLLDSTTGLTFHEEMRLADFIFEESMERGLDPILVLALMETESKYYNWSRSSKGAVGLMQLRSDIGSDLAAKLDIDFEGEKTLYDPYTNVRLGVYYLSLLRDKFDDTEVAMAAYNNGPTRVAYRVNNGGNVPHRFKTRVYNKYRDMKQTILEG
ncbi:MAG: lytic transglycosylase domain-containing protein [Deltaproteobacteria bacterium]|nr:lytic transglycosylase domain-containing protein [Deltaproteobacteria bacterium]